jgi:hypothetical protein
MSYTAEMMVNYRDAERAYKAANPWVIFNLQNSGAACGRYPTREAAIEAGTTYRGGVVEVDDARYTVCVSEIPRL